MSTKQERGISYVRERVNRSQDRIIHLTNDNRLRDLDEIWKLTTYLRKPFSS